MDDNTISRDIFKQSGKKGGSKTKERFGKEFYAEIGKRGAKKRWDEYRRRKARVDKMVGKIKNNW